MKIETAVSVLKTNKSRSHCKSLSIATGRGFGKLESDLSTSLHAPCYIYLLNDLL